MVYLKKYLGYWVLLLIAAAACQFVFLAVGGPLVVRALLKIVLCSIVTNSIFVIAFHKTPEFQRLKQYVDRLWAKLSKRERDV